MTINLPPDFCKQMQVILGAEFIAFEASLQASSPISIRLNPAKFQSEDNEQVAWCEQGRYLTTRPIFTLDPLFHAGAYYVQEASSMLVGYALSQVVDVSKPLNVLDLCAAPGGKTTHLLSVLHSESLVLANEVIKGRVNILKENLQKWGSSNIHVSNHDPDDFEALAGFFDVVLVDAPCSGEGLFRKQSSACAEWSIGAVEMCALRQQRILAAAANLVRHDGILLYSTCTYNATENQRNAEWLIDSFDFAPIKLPIPTEWGVVEQQHGYQCFPHKTKGEGFYLSVFKKKNTPIFAHKIFDFKSFKKLPHALLPQVKEWLREPEKFGFFIKPNQDVIAVLESQIDDLKILDKVLRAKGLGLEMGTMKGKDFVPSHSLALSTELATDRPSVELSRADALRFLKRENFVLEAPKGWLLIKYEGLGLGWIKNLGNRFNNYLPNEWRIRMEIE